MHLSLYALAFWVAVFPTYFLSSSCCVPLDPCPSIPHSLSPKSVGQRGGHLLEFATEKAMGHSSCPSLPGTEQGVGVGCQVTYRQTTGQGQGIGACREASEASLKGWFLSTASCRRFCVSACVPGFLLSLRTRKSKKSEEGFQAAQMLFGIPS